jgi:hypothetical protein
MQRAQFALGLPKRLGHQGGRQRGHFFLPGGRRSTHFFRRPSSTPSRFRRGYTTIRLRPSSGQPLPPSKPSSLEPASHASGASGSSGAASPRWGTCLGVPRPRRRNADAADAVPGFVNGGTDSGTGASRSSRSVEMDRQNGEPGEKTRPPSGLRTSPPATIIN